MRKRLALLAAACLLPGAALPDPATLLSVYECRAGYQASFDLTSALTAIKEATDESQAPNTSLNRYFAVPAGFRPYGLTPAMLGTNTGVQNGNTLISVLFSTDAPYAEVEAAVLAAHGMTRCPRRSREVEAENCTVFVRIDEPERPILMIQAYDGMVVVSCGYTRNED